MTHDVLKTRGLSSENKDKWAERRVGGGRAGEEGMGGGRGVRTLDPSVPESFVHNLFISPPLLPFIVLRGGSDGNLCVQEG